MYPFTCGRFCSRENFRSVASCPSIRVNLTVFRRKYAVAMKKVTTICFWFAVFVTYHHFVNGQLTSKLVPFGLHFPCQKFRDMLELRQTSKLTTLPHQHLHLCRLPFAMVQQVLCSWFQFRHPRIPNNFPQSCNGAAGSPRVACFTTSKTA